MQCWTTIQLLRIAIVFHMCLTHTHLLSLDACLPLLQHHLNVAWGGHVGVDATMCTVSASPLGHGLVNLDVVDEQALHIQALQLQHPKIGPK